MEPVTQDDEGLISSDVRPERDLGREFDTLADHDWEKPLSPKDAAYWEKPANLERWYKLLPNEGWSREPETVKTDVPISTEHAYWGRQANLGRWYDLIAARPPGETVPDWLDEAGIRTAYDYFSKLNEGRTWANWDKTPEANDPIWGFLETLPLPPEEEAVRLDRMPLPNATPEEETTITPPGFFGMTEEQWNSLPAWKQIATRIFNTGATAGAATGAVAGLQGGIPGAIFGGVLGGLFGAAVSPPSKTTYEGQYPGAAKISETYWDPTKPNAVAGLLSMLDLGAQATKRLAGTVGLIGLGAVGSAEKKATGKTGLPTFDKVMSNIEQAWQVSELVYRVLPNREILKAAATPLTPQSLAARYGVKTAERIIKNLEDVGLDVPDALQNGLEYIAPYLEGNVWRVIQEREKGKPETAWQMGTTETRELNNSEVGYQAFTEAFDRLVAGESMEDIFAEYQQRYGFEGEMRDLFGNILADPINFAGLGAAKAGAKGGKLLGFSDDFVKAMDSSTGMVEGLRKYRATTKLAQSFDQYPHLNSVEKWLSPWTSEGKAKILDKPVYTNPVERAWGYVTTLTPEARAKDVVDGLGLNLSGILDRADYDPVTMQRYVDGIANTDPRVAAEIGLRSLGGSEAAALPVALRDWSPKGRALVEGWQAGKWSRDILAKIGKVTGRSADDILKSLNDLNGKEADILARQFTDAARTSLDEAAQGIVSAYESGDFSGKTLQDIAKAYLKDGAPLTEADFMQRYFTGLMDHVEKWTAEYFGVKPDPLAIRLSNTIKNAQGLAMLDLSPNYLFQNAIDNTFKLAYEGVIGFDGKAKRQNFWQRFGVEHPRAAETFIQREKNVSGAIAQAKIQEGGLENLNKSIRSLRRKIGIASELSSKAEGWASDTALYNGVNQAMTYLWRPDVGFERVPPALERMLNSIQPDLARTVERKIRSGLSKAEIEKAIFETAGRKNVDDVLPDVSRILGVDDAMARDALQKAGAFDYLKDNIPVNAEDADVRKAFQGLREKISKQFDDWSTQRLKAEVEKAKNTAKAEGPLGMIDLFDEIALDETTTHIGGYDGWERVFEAEGMLTPDEFSGLIAEQRKQAKAQWKRTWDRRRANYVGILEQLGLEDQYGRALENILIDQEKNWSDFHNFKWESWKEAGKKQGTMDWAAARDKVRAETRAAFIKATEKELALQKQMDVELVRSLEAWYGPEIAEVAKTWRNGVAEIREHMTSQMLAFRERIENLPPDRKRAEWSKFLAEEYKPAIIERMHQNITGAHEVYRLATRTDPIPRPMEITPADQFVNEARTKWLKEKYNWTPEQLDNINEVRRIAGEFGIGSAKPNGDPDTGFNKRLLAIVEKYGGQKFEKIEDLTPEVVRQALEERARIKGGEAPKPAPVDLVTDPTAEINAEAKKIETERLTKNLEKWRREVGAEKTEPAKVPDPNPIGDAPPGTVAGLYDLDIGKLFEEGWNETINPLLDLLQEKLTGEGGKTTGLKGIDLAPEQMKQLRQYLERQYIKLGDAKMAAQTYGMVARDTALLNYNKRYGVDNLLNTVMPYQFWYTRSAINWALRAIDHPAWLIQYGRIRGAQERLSKTGNGFPARLRGKMAIPFPWLPEGWGNTVYVDPLHQIFSFEGMLGQTIKPLQRDEANRIKKTEWLIQQMAGDGQISEQQMREALANRAGAIWDKAMTQATMELESEVANPLDLINTMSAFSWPLQIAYQKMMGRENKINPVPSLQAITNVTSFFTPGGINAGGWLQKALGAPERGFLNNYYIERELRNMAMTGEYEIEDVVQAMIDQRGPIWTAAQDRTGKQQATRSFTAQLWLDFFPEGEQKARQLQQEFSQAYESGTLPAFFDAYPEYEAQMTLGNWDDPEERMKRFMISAVWDAYSGLDPLSKREATKQLGDLFQNAFLNKATRSYDSIDLETATLWARQLGSKLPETAPKVPQVNLDLPSKDLSGAYQLYLDTRKQEFGNIDILQSAYYRLPEAMQKQFRQQNPTLGQYWEWRDLFISKHPELIPYMVGEESKLAGVAPEIQMQVYAYKGEKAQYFPGINAIQDQYYSLKGAMRKAYLVDHPELRQYWDWQKERLAQTPTIIPYIKSSETIAEAVLGTNYEKGYRADTSKFDQLVTTALLGYTLRGKPLGEGAKSELYRIWKEEKRPLGSFDVWLEQVYQAYSYNR